MIPFLKRLIHLTQKSKYSPINRIINGEELERQQEKKELLQNGIELSKGETRKKLFLHPTG